MNVATILKAVRTLLANPENWTQRAFARDANGDKVSPEDPSAVCWCLRGAILRIAPDIDDRDRAYQALSEQFGFRSIIVRNDTVDHETILSWLDETIARVPA